MIALALLRRYWQLAAIVVLVGVLMIACHARDEALKAEGAARVQVRILTDKLRLDSLTAHTRDTVQRVDSIHLVRWATKYDTVRKTVKLTDTIAVREYITVADSTIGACKQNLLSLYSSCQAKDTVIATQRALLALKVTPAPAKVGWSQKLLYGAIGAAAGALADRATH